jgi:hypothetical protein
MVQITDYPCPKHKHIKLEKHNQGFWCSACERYYVKEGTKPTKNPSPTKFVRK